MKEIEVIYHKASKKNAPIIFTTHGFDFNMDDYTYDHFMLKMISEEFSCNVVSIFCRKILKCKFPCAVNCLYDVISYFIKNANKFDFDKNNVIILGSSMGANFAAATTLLDRNNKTNFIKTQILNYPYLDLSKKEKNNDLLFFQKYVNDDAELKNPFVSPIYASQKDLQNMPKTIITYGEKDLLRHDDEQYAKMLEDSGTEVYCKSISGMEHGFLELYYLLKYMPKKSSIVSNKMRESFKSGALAKGVLSTIEFIKKHCI